MIILTLYTTGAGIVCFAVLLQEFLSHLKYLFPYGPDQQDSLPKILKIPCVGDFNMFDIKCVLASSLIGLYWLITKNWIANNILGM